jgi:hypothetical protein
MSLTGLRCRVKNLDNLISESCDLIPFNKISVPEGRAMVMGVPKNGITFLCHSFLISDRLFY